MGQDRRTKSEKEVFHSSKQKFELLMEKIEADETLRMSHFGLEAVIKEHGFELLRQLFQDHLILRATREQRVVVADSDGIELTHYRTDCVRKLETIFGTVEVHRCRYSKPDAGSAHPLDVELNLPGDRYSHGMEERVAEETAKGSFDNVVVSIKKTTGGNVPTPRKSFGAIKTIERQAEELAVKAAQDFEAFYEQRQAQEAEDDDSLLVMSTDGKGIAMRKEDLRKATRQKAEKNQERKKRLGSGEKRNRKRMATVAAIYSIDEHHRSAEHIMGDDEDDDIIRPRPRNKRVWADVEAPPEVVTQRMFEEALRRDPPQARRWVMLVDGDPHQLERIKAAREKFGVDVTVVLDFIHVLEYLWNASYAFYEPGSDEALQWVRQRGLRILQGKASDVAAGMRRSATRRGLKGSKRKAVDKCAGYLLNNRDYLMYDLYLEAGFPVGTGVIEGACRHLVKDRMDLTGARWRLNGAQAVLRLRALRARDDFQDYLRFHRAQERQRSYTSKFTTRQTPAVAEAA